MGYGDLAKLIREELSMTTEQLAERIKNYYKHQKGYVIASMVVYYVEQLEREMGNESKDTEGFSNIERSAKEEDS